MIVDIPNVRPNVIPNVEPNARPNVRRNNPSTKTSRKMNDGRDNVRCHVRSDVRSRKLVVLISGNVSVFYKFYVRLLGLFENVVKIQRHARNTASTDARQL